ncbi:hypothetical protein [Emcibacter sp.]|uniref:hypothetical protein n=1 Tax=Emcibacter sp. TaxID=1979954 RepID=UPI002AA731D6|nr:hypothetical protein [Emcibacter sp.]
MPAYLQEILYSLAILPEFRYLLFWLLYGLPWALLIKTLNGRMKTVLWLYLGTFIAGISIYSENHFYELNIIVFVTIITLAGFGVPMYLIDDELERAGFLSGFHKLDRFLAAPGTAQVCCLLLCLYIWSGRLSARLWPEHFGIRPIDRLYEAELPLELEERYWTMSKRFLLGLSIVLFGEFLLFQGAPIWGYAVVTPGFFIGGTAFFTRSCRIDRNGLAISRLFRKPHQIPWSDIASFERLTPHPLSGIRITLKPSGLPFSNYQQLPSRYGYDPEALSLYLNDMKEKIGSGGALPMEPPA